MDWSSDLESLGTVALAGGLGAVVGLERELSDKPAGLRTHIFVSAGAALLMLLGDMVLDNFEYKGSGLINADPIRVIQAIVIGISFLGAGTIIHQGGDRIEGLTTAASIFLTAGIGIAVAVEHVVLSAGTAILAVLVLALLGWIERRFTGKEPAREADGSSTSSGQNVSRRSAVG